MIKQEAHQIKGIQRDLTVSKFNPEFAFDAQNIRITVRDGKNTLLSITNEKGTEPVSISGNPILGTVIGYNVLNDFLTLFTTSSGTDRIYLITKSSSGQFNNTILFQGNLGFDPSHPIETIGISENIDINKVYWTDGINRPRMINLGKTYGNINKFDFARDIDTSNLSITVSYNNNVRGYFPIGTVQYMATLFDKHGQESSIFWESDVFFTYQEQRGGSPEETGINSFNIRVSGLDNTFERFRLFSIVRTSESAVPTVRVVGEYKFGSGELNIIDTYNSGYTIDNNEILYKGGYPITAYTIASKDNTLFLGNIKLEMSSIPESVRTALKSLGVAFAQSTVWAGPSYIKAGQYTHEPVFNPSYMSFKGGDTYRFGVQFLHSTGRWSEVCYIGDFTNTVYPQIDFSNIFRYKNVIARLTVPVYQELRDAGYTDWYRPVVVYPEFNDRNVIAQGLLCPTMYTIGQRQNNSIYGISSFFMRGLTDVEHVKSDSSFQSIGSVPEFRDGFSDNDMNNTSYSYNAYGYSTGIECTPIVQYRMLAFHSPDIDLNEDITSLSDPSLKMRIIGVSRFGGLTAYRETSVSTPGLKGNDAGMINSVPSQKIWRGLSWQDRGGVLSSGITWKAADTDGNVYGWLISPWQHSGSIIGDNDSDVPACKLRYNRTSNLRYMGYTQYFTSIKNYIPEDIKIWNYSDSIDVIRLSDGSDYYNYMGNVDMIVTSMPCVQDSNYGIEYGETYITRTAKTGNDSELYKAMDSSDGVTPVALGYYASSVKYKSGKHTVLLMGNNFTLPNPYGSHTHRTVTVDTHERTEVTVYRQRQSRYFDIEYVAIGDWSNEIGSPATIDSSNTSEQIIDTKVTESDLYNQIWTNGDTSKEETSKEQEVSRVTSDQKYENETDYATVGPVTEPVGYVKFRDYVYTVTVKTQWTVTYTDDHTEPTVSLGNADENCDYWFNGSNGHTSGDLIYIAEIYRDSVTNRFGGTDDLALESNIWEVAGNPVKMGNPCLVIGDTYITLYDCLKTMPYTFEDENQLTEIVSFICESRVNCDGRYDRNRGLVNNTVVSNSNFNLINPIYNYRRGFIPPVYQDNTDSTDRFPNQIVWSLEKSMGEDIDTWTNINMASVMDLDGDKGEVISLNTFNNELYCLQRYGFSNILFNSRIQIPTSDNVPIEITNGMKVTGKRYISNSIGCLNKWSVCETPIGLYFADNTTNSIYMFNGQLVSLSDNLGMRSWVNDINSNESWDPVRFNNIVTYYDKNNNDLYFITADTALVYSEFLRQFTSFMSYEEVPYMFNIGSDFYSIKGSALWKMFSGDYNMFFYNYKPYSITFVSNADEPYDKIFNNVEFRADCWNGNTLKYTNTFDTLEVWNEYQKGVSTLSNVIGKPSSLKSKFRVWRANVPRFNTDWNGIKANNRDRIRNTWAYVKLAMNKENTNRMEFHDMIVHYFV